MTKTYFLAPTRDCPPSGPIALGSIITSPASPEIPLIPPVLIDRALMPVSETYTEDWKFELEKHRKGKVGLWARFMEMLGLGADLSVSYDNSKSDRYAFKRLETRTFWPTKAYVEASITAPDVQQFLALKRFRQNLYMIVGIKIAVGATISSSTLRKRGIYVHMGIDGTAAGFPVTVGPKADLVWSTREGVSSQGGSDFVFAFRLREICYTTKRGVMEREFTKGALFGLDDGMVDKEKKDEKEERKGDKEEDSFALLGLAEEDVSGEDVGEDPKGIEEELGEKCECVVLDDPAREL